MAFLSFFVVIFLLMLVYYNTSGWVANIALILNLLFTVGILAGFGATLTAPGIAGLVLTIGMAVDTNVIIYERIKEELTKGKGYIPAINEGYKRSLTARIGCPRHYPADSDHPVLFWIGTGKRFCHHTDHWYSVIPVLWYPGEPLDNRMFTNKKKHLEYFTGISSRIFKHAKYKFIEFRKVAYVISFVVLALGIASFFNGFDYGVEFKGGRSYTVRFDKNVGKEIEQISDELKASLDDENPIIKTIGDASTLDITTSYLIKDTSPEVDSIVSKNCLTGLKNICRLAIHLKDLIMPMQTHRSWQDRL